MQAKGWHRLATRRPPWPDLTTSILTESDTSCLASQLLGSRHTNAVAKVANARHRHPLENRDCHDAVLARSDIARSRALTSSPCLGEVAELPTLRPMAYPDISKRVRLELREHLVGFVLRDIETLFESEGFERFPISEDNLPSGQRRSLAEEYLRGIDWGDQDHRRRFLRVIEQVLDAWDMDEPPQLLKLLERDGYTRDNLGQLVPSADAEVLTLPTELLTDDRSIKQELTRIVRASDADAGQVIQASRALVESTCKLVLREKEQWPDYLGAAPDMPALMRAALEALDLHPQQVDNEKWEVNVVDASKRTLGSLIATVGGLSELRRLVGHGQDHPTSLPLRWGHLAAYASAAVCGFLLETLAQRQ